MLLFIDNTKRNTDDYILRYKLEARETFKELNILQKLESGTEVKQFGTDSGGESTSKKLAVDPQSGGILMKMTAPCTVESNSVVQHGNNTSNTQVQIIVDDASLLKQYWPLAVSVGCYHRNCTPTHHMVGIFLHEAKQQSGTKPSLNNLWVFVWLAFVHVPTEI
jgi:hypothetical protein